MKQSMVEAIEAAATELFGHKVKVELTRPEAVFGDYAAKPDTWVSNLRYYNIYAIILLMFAKTQDNSINSNTRRRSRISRELSL